MICPVEYQLFTEIIMKRTSTSIAESSVLSEEHFFQETPVKFLNQKNDPDTLWFLLIQYKGVLRFTRKICSTENGSTVIL